MPANASLDKDNLPRHIAIIMDGNGRWAKDRGLPRIMGHQAGVKTVQEIVAAARELGIQVLTLYAFSTENWQRPPQEVMMLMGLLKTYLQSELNKMVREGIQLRCIGQQDKLPADVREILDKVVNDTAGSTGMVLNLALSYGGRAEIIQAVQALAAQCVAGTLDYHEISEAMLGQHLYTAGLPDPDLVIRTSGEYRLSNFLLWQASYAEIYVTETKWPDFTRAALIEAIQCFQQRQRRFGKTGDQKAAQTGAA